MEDAFDRECPRRPFLGRGPFLAFVLALLAMGALPLVLHYAADWIDARNAWQLGGSFLGVLAVSLALRGAWLRVQEFGAPCPGTVARPVHGTVRGESSFLRAVFLAKDLVRVDAREDGLRIRRRTAYAYVFGAGWCWMVLLDVLRGAAGFQATMVVLVPVAACGLLLLARDPPASRRRRAVPWASVRVVVETAEGADLHVAGERRADSLSLVLDRFARARLLAMVDGRAPVVLLPPPPPRPGGEASDRIDPGKMRELDDTLARLRRM